MHHAEQWEEAADSFSKSFGPQLPTPHPHLKRVASWLWVFIVAIAFAAAFWFSLPRL